MLNSLKNVFINSVYASSYKKIENIVKLDIDDEINTNLFKKNKRNCNNRNIKLKLKG